VGAPVVDIEAVRQGTRRILRATGDLTDEQAAARSRLPGWSRAEVLTHLARNADGVCGIAASAARGEVGRQYPGGADQRTADIAAGRGVGASALLADLRKSCDGLMDAWLELPDDAWERVGASLTGERTQRGWVWARWREVEVHHVDLGLGYSPAEWPVAFVTRGLGEAFAELPGRAVAGGVPFNARIRIEATDHDRAWLVRTDARGRADVDTQPDDDAAVDATVTGWGCDVLAWLYGRDPGGAGLNTTGEPAALDLPAWFPFG
jgi:maleylpyruvate isomerase